MNIEYQILNLKLRALHIYIMLQHINAIMDIAYYKSEVTTMSTVKNFKS